MQPFDCRSVGTEHSVSFLFSFGPAGVVAQQLEADIAIWVPSEVDAMEADRMWVSRAS